MIDTHTQRLYELESMEEDLTNMHKERNDIERNIKLGKVAKKDIDTRIREQKKAIRKFKKEENC